MAGNNPKIGDIWIAFEGTKRRPVLIVNEGFEVVDTDLEIARVTSQPPKDEYDIELKHWKEAGLNSPSVVRCSKIKIVEPENLKYKIGCVLPEELDKVHETIEKRWRTIRLKTRLARESK